MQKLVSEAKEGAEAALLFGKGMEPGLQKERFANGTSKHAER